MSRWWRVLILCSAWTTLGLAPLAAQTDPPKTPHSCDELCRALLGLSPDPQDEIGPPQTFQAKLSRSRDGKIDYYFYLNEDCSPAAAVDIEVVEPPRAGLVAANNGRDRAFYPAGNQRSLCNGRQVSSSRLFYLRNPGTFQADHFAVVAIYPDGTWQEVRYHVPRR